MYGSILQAFHANRDDKLIYSYLENTLSIIAIYVTEKMPQPSLDLYFILIVSPNRFQVQNYPKRVV